MNVDACVRDVWCVDLANPHRLARETLEDRTELLTGGADRLLRRRLLRAELAARWSIHPDVFRFHRDASGQVSLLAPRPAFISTAQRGSMIANALSAAPIGIDIELRHSIAASDIEAVCPEWSGLDPTSRWTAFEALGKLFSVGTAAPAHDIALYAASPSELRVSLAGCKVRIVLMPYNDHQIAIAEFEQ